MTRTTARLVAPVAIIASAIALSAPAAADTMQTDEPEISAKEAKTLAERFLRAQGYTRALSSQQTMRVEQAELISGTWQVSVRLGGHLPAEKGIVLVDAETGAIQVES